jgi:hypothetical protein
MQINETKPNTIELKNKIKKYQSFDGSSLWKILGTYIYYPELKRYCKAIVYDRNKNTLFTVLANIW